jgi:hypothetical protein
MESNSAIIIIEYIRERLIGRYIKSFNQENSSIWERLKTRYINYADTIITDDFIETPWPNILDTIREFGSKQFQNSLNFRFQPSKNLPVRSVKPDFLKIVYRLL